MSSDLRKAVTTNASKQNTSVFDGANWICMSDLKTSHLLPHVRVQLHIHVISSTAPILPPAPTSWEAPHGHVNAYQETPKREVSKWLRVHCFFEKQPLLWFPSLITLVVTKAMAKAQSSLYISPFSLKPSSKLLIFFPIFSGFISQVLAECFCNTARMKEKGTSIICMHTHTRTYTSAKKSLKVAPCFC